MENRNQYLLCTFHPQKGHKFDSQRGCMSTNIWAMCVTDTLRRKLFCEIAENFKNFGKCLKTVCNCKRSASVTRYNNFKQVFYIIDFFVLASKTVCFLLHPIVHFAIAYFSWQSLYLFSLLGSLQCFNLYHLHLLTWSFPEAAQPHFIQPCPVVAENWKNTLAKTSIRCPERSNLNLPPEQVPWRIPLVCSEQVLTVPLRL